jgi:ceramide glucosyltransferase
MLIYYIFSAGLILTQLVILVEAYRHLVFTVRKYRPKPPRWTPPAAIISPCKGLDNTFDRNIRSFFDQDYPDYSIYFVVESTEDPAYARLRDLIEEHRAAGGTVPAQVVVAGVARTRGQKIHNLLAGVDAAGETAAALTFVDSDACLERHWLRAIVHPLRREDIGASTGYRWFVPTDGRLSTQVLSAMNSNIASLLGPHGWNAAWGGGMAIKKANFEHWGVRQAWMQGCSDDYALTNRVKKAGLTVAFVPACFVASYEQMSWGQMWNFGQRQFILTWFYARRLWWLGVAGFSQYLMGFWTGVGVSCYLWWQGSTQVKYAAILPAFLYIVSMMKASARQIMIRRILPRERRKLLIPAILDLLFQPFTTLWLLICLLSTARSKSMVWRGHRYRLIDADHTEITPMEG